MHAPLGRQVDSLGEDVYVPSAQAVHSRSALALGLALTCVPALQTLQGVQLGAFAAVLKVPLAHGAHVRSNVAPPAAATDWPGTHSVQATHAVAASPSWSQVPGAHDSFGIEAPAQ